MVTGLDGVGTDMLCKFDDRKLFRIYIDLQKATSKIEMQLNDCRFADDTALLATTKSGTEQAALTNIEVAKTFGLTVSLTKTKLMVTGCAIYNSDSE